MYLTSFYNLDVIISIGYRVKSLQSTKFRIWATKVLREHLLKKKILASYKEQDISSVVRLIGKVTNAYNLSKDEDVGLLKVISDYMYALDILDQFDKKELYLSLDEKAANLLYLVIKNHSFIDGNKRIAAAILITYLAKNNFLYNSLGNKRIADNALVALCLMIAQSNPKEKDTMIKVVVNLINKNN